jgi:diguanylate cyclase (GGDEF)-like protein
MTPELESHLRSFVNFPTPPGIAAHIIEIAKDPNLDMSTVAQAVSLDPALSSKILRIANSPLYAQRRKSENLRQALVVLGLNATLTLALSFSLLRALRSGKPNGIDYPFYWRRALISAISARTLGEAMHQPFVEELFLAALLQDVGILALDSADPDLYRGAEHLQRDHLALAQYEVKRICLDHAQVGAWLMQSWNLPQRLNQAIANSHQMDLRNSLDSAECFNRCVALSGSVADLFILPSAMHCVAQTAQGVERGLGLNRQQFGAVIGTVGALIPEAAAIYETDLHCAQDTDSILEQARDVLMIRNLHALRDVNTRTRNARHEARNAAESEDTRDALTGAYNRLFVDESLWREFDSASRHGWPLSIAYVDLDNFKKINDTFGQQAGDRILQTTARILRDNSRESDVIARYGREEFALILPATDAETVRQICERIVVAFQTARHDIGSSSIMVTVSIGCATHSPADPFGTVAELVRAADQALYTAKLQGRNRTVPHDRRGAEAAARRH